MPGLRKRRERAKERDRRNAGGAAEDGALGNSDYARSVRADKIRATLSGMEQRSAVLLLQFKSIMIKLGWISSLYCLWRAGYADVSAAQKYLDAASVVLCATIAMNIRKPRSILLWFSSIAAAVQLCAWIYCYREGMLTHQHCLPFGAIFLAVVAIPMRCLEMSQRMTRSSNARMQNMADLRKMMLSEEDKQ